MFRWYWFVLFAVPWAVVIGGISLAADQDNANHVFNGIRHGCPFDPGCVDEDPDGDYVRHGYMRVVDGTPMAYAEVIVVHASDLRQVAFESCFNCKRVDVQFDTGGEPECRFRTYHAVLGERINGHYHDTLVGPC